MTVEYFADPRPESPDVKPREFHRPDGSFKRRETEHEYRERQAEAAEGHHYAKLAHDYAEAEKWQTFAALLEGNA